MGWDISTASYASKSFDYSATLVSSISYDTHFVGSKVYLMEYGTRKIWQFSITGGDVSTMSYDSKNFDPVTESSSPIGAFIKSDGSKLYVLDNTSSIIYQYSLTSGNIDTASYDSKSFDLSTQGSFFRNITFNSTGSKLYAARDTTDIYQYSLSTPWDISTASYDSVTLDCSGETTDIRDLVFGDSGTKVYIVSKDDYYVYQYNLTGADDLSTGSYSGKSFAYTQGFGTASIQLNSTGDTLYMTDFTYNIFQYDVGGGLVTPVFHNNLVRQGIA